MLFTIEKKSKKELGNKTLKEEQKLVERGSEQGSLQQFGAVCSLRKLQFTDSLLHVYFSLRYLTQDLLVFNNFTTNIGLLTEVVENDTVITAVVKIQQRL
eukprot:TRINITY_DN3179_c0_g2_i5.p8 TRINITY_DN3179_c0_g2~~TRINITY_DN3179_c0_g2_i5.p8  ORF type:complete len:100 (+),score=6.11 TRINITY_DN3179_c0_g2_i5:213-512(+)